MPPGGDGDTDPQDSLCEEEEECGEADEFGGVGAEALHG
jgi:hypothetical protein